MFPTERRAASFYPEIPPSSLQCWAGNQDRNLIKASMHGMMEKGEWWRERWRGKEMEERELNDQQRCRETWDMAVFCFSGTACSLRFPHVQSKQARQTPVSSSERKREREVETERGMRETCRLSDTQSFYPLMCLMVPFDSKVYYRVLSPKPGPRMSVLTNWTWWLKRCRSGLTNSLGSVLQSLSCTPSTGYHPSFHHFSTVQTNGVLQWFSPLAVYLATLWIVSLSQTTPGSFPLAVRCSSAPTFMLCIEIIFIHVPLTEVSIKKKRGIPTLKWKQISSCFLWLCVQERRRLCRRNDGDLRHAAGHHLPFPHAQTQTRGVCLPQSYRVA